MSAHPAPWWFRLANRIAPSRCREIPLADAPERGVLLRQVAIVHRHVYLQQFAQSESAEYLHSHPWRRLFAIGLWGSYTEHRLNETGGLRRRAPYFYTMDGSTIHQVVNPTPGHTSIFIGLFRDDRLKFYYKKPVTLDAQELERGNTPSTTRVHADLWIKQRVKSI